MNTREVMQQALEALELGYDAAKAEADQYHAAMAGYRPQRHAKMDADAQKIAAAITALRAALAEPQEPVAFAFRHSDGSWHDISETEHSAGMTALYTHPSPQRQPLTEEQIIALRKSTRTTDFSAWSDSIAFARAVEKAHGITGEMK